MEMVKERVLTAEEVRGYFATERIVLVAEAMGISEKDVKKALHTPGNPLPELRKEIMKMMDKCPTGADMLAVITGRRTDLKTMTASELWKIVMEENANSDG